MSSDFICYELVEKSLNNDDNLAVKSCDCLPDCNMIDYVYEVIRDERVNRNESLFDDKERTYYLDTRAVVRFGNDDYFATKRYASYRSVEFISSIGGLLGIFLGISVMSLIEIFYFFAFRVLNDLCSNLSLQNDE